MWWSEEYVCRRPRRLGGDLVNSDAAIAGRTSVNLNHTAGTAGHESASRQAGLTTVVTSGMFVAKANLELPDNVEPIWIEDIAKGLGTGDKLQATLLALFGPLRSIHGPCRRCRPPRPDSRGPTLPTPRPRPLC